MSASMSARDAILSAIAATLGPRPAQAAIDAEAQALLLDFEDVRPALPPGPLPDAFAARATSAKVGATLERIGTLAELPGRVAAYLGGHGLPHALALQQEPPLLALDWSAFTLRDAALPDEAAAVGLARQGIAETGSLVFHSGPDTAVLGHFLPLHHIAVLHARDVLPHLEDLAPAPATLPRNLNLVTGASGTTDIEGSYVRGAHGPRHLHIVLVGG